MSIPFFLPHPRYLTSINTSKSLNIIELCKNAGIECKASGDWVNREVEIKHGKDLAIEAEPGDWGKVRIFMPKAKKSEEAKLALTVLAYSLNDLVAKQSIKGESFARVPIPKGRIRTGKALTNAERQRLFRSRN